MTEISPLKYGDSCEEEAFDAFERMLDKELCATQRAKGQARGRERELLLTLHFTAPYFPKYLHFHRKKLAFVVSKINKGMTTTTGIPSKEIWTTLLSRSMCTRQSYHRLTPTVLPS